MGEGGGREGGWVGEREGGRDPERGEQCEGERKEENHYKIQHYNYSNHDYTCLHTCTSGPCISYLHTPGIQKVVFV